MSFSFRMPEKIVYGPGAIDDARSAIAEAGGSHALIVADPVTERLGILTKVKAVLDQIGIAYQVYDGVDAEPTDKMVEAGAAIADSYECDMLVGVGGGSPIDCMKAIALRLASGMPIAAFIGERPTVSTLPMVAIPTTAGSGSEATMFASITDTESNEDAHVKMLLRGPALMPTLAVVDPSFTLGTPRDVMAGAGIDVLCHTLESITSSQTQPLTEGYAANAAGRVFEYLVRAVEDPDDEVAHDQMAVASLESGIAFSSASGTILYGMSRPLGARFGVPHGYAVAMLTVPCLEYQFETAYGALARLARRSGSSTQADDRAAARELLERVGALIDRLGVPSIRDYLHGDEKAYLDALPKMAEDAIVSGSPAYTLRLVAKADIVRVYRSLLG